MQPAPSVGDASGRPESDDRKVLHQVYVRRMKILREKLAECGVFHLCRPFTPFQYIDVGWGATKETEDVCLFGNELPLRACVEKPRLIFEIPANFLFTIVAIDADYVDETGKCAPYLLWQRCNVAMDEYAAGARDLVRWQPPHPFREEGLHRIFFFVIEQPHAMVLSEPGETIIAKYSRESRAAFDIEDLRTKHSLGRFVGCNCCRVGFDPEITPRIRGLLRDKVLLDKRGTKVVAEIRDGVMVTLDH